jgi:hypothetical protein
MARVDAYASKIESLVERDVRVQRSRATLIAKSGPRR